MNYTLTAYGTLRKLTTLCINISKYNSAVAGRKNPQNSYSASADSSRGVSRAVPQSRQLGGGSQRTNMQLTPSKKTKEDMKISTVIDDTEVSSKPLMPTSLEKGEEPDVEEAMKILSEFNLISKDCWPIGQHFTFNVNCFNCEKLLDKWVVRTHQDQGVKWQINNPMNNVKWDMQIVCHVQDVAPTKATWPEVSKGECQYILIYLFIYASLTASIVQYSTVSIVCVW